MNIITCLKSRSKSLCKKSRALQDKAFIACVGLAGAIAAVTPARAEGDIDDLFAALNLTGLSGNIKTLMLVGAGITLLFIGYTKLKKTGNRI